MWGPEIFVGRRQMKSKTTLAVLAIAALSLVPRLHAACSNVTLAGTYGFTTAGTLFVPSPAPVGATGAITFDSNGNASGSQDRSVAGEFAHETIQGTYTIDSGCAVRLVANVYDDSGNLVRTSKIDGVLINNGKQIRAIFESVTLPDGTDLPSVLTVEGNRIQGHQ
jgi:hypothetical protein